MLEEHFPNFKNWSELIKTEKESGKRREKVGEISIPCCHECMRPLEYEELKEVLEGRMKLTKKDYEKLQKEGKEAQCYVCQKGVKKGEELKLDKEKVVHKECFDQLVKMDCCKVLVSMEAVREQQLGAEPEEADDLFCYDPEGKMKEEVSERGKRTEMP